MHGRVKPTAALVLETNNLRGGGAGADRLCESLERLLRHLRLQTRSLDSLSEIVITHEGLEPRHHARLEAAAGRSLTLCAVAARRGYYEAKNVGFAATQSSVVAFGDADCWPDAHWLERLLQPFDRDDGGPEVVAGRTTYRGDVLGIAATTIDFMYFESPLGEGCVRNFYANNVAFRREVFATHCYSAQDGVYRGHCQVLGLLLQARGIRVCFVPEARTTHRFPDTLRELIALRLLRGKDTVELTPHLAKAYLPLRFTRLARVRALSAVVLGMRFAYSVRAIGKQDMPSVTGVRALGCLALVAGLSSLDVAGAVHRVLRPNAAQADASALSYHDDRDHLVSSNS